MFIKKKLPLLKITACCDTNTKKLNKIIYKDVTKYTNINNMLNNETLDLVLILTPSGFHYKHTKTSSIKGSKCVM